MKEIEISDIDCLIKILNKYNNGFAFRGQANAEWTLQSSLERVANSFGNRKKVEEFTFEEFKRKFSLYSEKIERPENKLSWLSLMQHYGIPTRLLDFTTSPYVALYFAIESCDPFKGGYFSIYSIDYNKLIEKSCNYVACYNSCINGYIDNFSEKCEEVFEKILDNNSYDVLWFVDPKQANDRLEKQAGTFLMSGSFNKTIDDIINSDIYSEVSIDKIKIPHEFLNNIYALLRKINLGPKNIYGNIEGLANHLKLQAKIYGVN